MTACTQHTATLERQADRVLVGDAGSFFWHLLFLGIALVCAAAVNAPITCMPLAGGGAGSGCDWPRCLPRLNSTPAGGRGSFPMASTIQQTVLVVYCTVRYGTVKYEDVY